MNNLISSGSFTWESSSTAGSTDAVSAVTNITKPSPAQKNYVLEVQNNSSESSLNVYLYVKEQFDTTSTSWCALDSFAVNASPDANNPDQTGKKSAKAVIIEGAHIALGMGMTAVLNSSVTSDAVGSQILTNPWRIREW